MSRAINGFIALVFCFSLFVFIAVLVNQGNDVPSVFGYSFLSVSTPSMEPAYPVGSVVVTKRGNAETYKPGDVISFYSEDPAIRGLPNTHRIVSVHRDKENNLYFITRGDNNPIPDRYEVFEDKVIGKVRGSVGSLGNILETIKSRYVIFFLLILPLSVLMFFEAKHIKRIIDGKGHKSSVKKEAAAADKTAENSPTDGNDEPEDLLEKINRIQAEIDRLNAESKNDDDNG